MKRFETTLNKVDEKDWPAEGEVFIAKDHEKHLGDDTWMVCRMGDREDHYGPDYNVLGFFYIEAMALFFYSKIGFLEWADLKSLENQIKSKEENSAQ